MRQSVAVLSLLAGAVCADEVLSFIFPGGFEGAAPVATIESANPSTTSAVLTCPSGTPSDECGFAYGLDVEIISGTRYQASMSAASVYVSYGCDVEGSEAQTMTCTAEISGEDPSTAVLSGTDVAFLTASVVEGGNLLSGGASATASATSATGASQSSSAAASSRTQASASVSGTAAAGSAASGSASSTASSAPESTGAAARFGIEGAAFLALAAAAVHVL